MLLGQSLSDGRLNFIKRLMSREDEIAGAGFVYYPTSSYCFSKPNV